MHDCEDTNPVASRTVNNAKREASANIASVGRLKLSGDLGILPNESPDAMNLVEEVLAKAGCARLVERYRFHELG